MSTNKGKRFPAEPLDDAEVRKLIAAVRGSGPLAVRNRALVAVLYGSGLRVAEALDLHPRDVVAGGRELNVRHGKGDKQRFVALHPEAAPLLGAWLATREALGLNGRQPVFCSVADGDTRKRGQAIDASYVRRLLPQLAKRAGIEKRVHAHGLRHTHATALVRSGAKLDVISGQLGHGSTATTDIYLARIAPEARIDELQRLWAQREPL
jgi:site-specific recombinase XerD